MCTFAFQQGIFTRETIFVCMYYVSDSYFGYGLELA